MTKTKTETLKMAIKYIERYSPVDRVLHWIIAISFSILILSGLGLYSKSLLPYMNLMGGPENAIVLHQLVGVVFFLSSLMMSAMHVRELLNFDSDDALWLGNMGGYLSRDGKEPPMGKYNTGQKIYGLFAIVATLVLGYTGWVLWHPDNYSAEALGSAMMWHSLLFVVIGCFTLVHIYLGTIGNPGTLSGILYGEVSEAWAKKHAPKWLAKKEAE
jgi:formate dehydrogenase subunit gamma